MPQKATTAMIFKRALGRRFEDLHPQLQRRFGFQQSCVGTGTMAEIWRGGRHTVPFLKLGTNRNILFPETGTDVPFVIENHVYQDSFGRDVVTFVRTFDVRAGLRRRFDATMIYSEARGAIVDYLGTHQHIAVDLHLDVDRRGGLHIRSGEQRFRMGGLDFVLPQALTGTADLHEWYDDNEECFRIRVTVSNPRFGPIFGYHGRFTAQYVDTPVPATVKPYREEARE